MNKRKKQITRKPYWLKSIFYGTIAGIALSIFNFLYILFQTNLQATYLGIIKLAKEQTLVIIFSILIPIIFFSLIGFAAYYLYYQVKTKPEEYSPTKIGGYTGLMVTLILLIINRITVNMIRGYPFKIIPIENRIISELIVFVIGYVIGSLIGYIMGKNKYKAKN